jgi:hypothetical protein
MVEKLRDPNHTLEVRMRVETLTLALAAIGYRHVRIGKDAEFCELIATAVGKSLSEMRKRNI